MEIDKAFFQKHYKTTSLHSGFLQASKQQITHIQPPSKNHLTEDDLKAIEASLTNFKEFSAQIGQLRDTSIRDDVKEHCNKKKQGLNTESFKYERIEWLVEQRAKKLIRNKKYKKNWSDEDLNILIWTVSKFSDFYTIRNPQRELNMEHWGKISQMIPGTKFEQCMFKWLSLQNHTLSQKSWSEQESQTLKGIVKYYKVKDWAIIAQDLYFLTKSRHKIYRSPKQCREHWNCYLNPELKKGPWSPEEDVRLLMKIVNNNGLKKWAEYVKQFEGRTENALKNRYNLILGRQNKKNASNKDKPDLEVIEEYLKKLYAENYLNESDSERLKKQGTEEIREKLNLRSRNKPVVERNEDYSGDLERKSDEQILGSIRLDEEDWQKQLQKNGQPFELNFDEFLNFST